MFAGSILQLFSVVYFSFESPMDKLDYPFIQNLHRLQESKNILLEVFIRAHATSHSESCRFDGKCPELHV